MSYPIKYPTPQGANIQILYKTDDWVKPQGASFVWFTLIGAGGGGGSANTGGCGTVTNFMGPAFLMPDVLRVVVGRGSVGLGETTSVIYQQKNGTGYTLLSATGGPTDGTSGIPVPANNFAAMGFYQSVGGVSGSGGTFLGAGDENGNYGYTTTGTNANGYFQMQPIIVGLGSRGSGKGGIGSGGGPSSGIGGDGLVVIITW